MLSDGRILATLPESGELVLFSEDGTRIGAWQPMAESKPIGVAALTGGGFAFSDATRNEVQIVPGDLVDNLFD